MDGCNQLFSQPDPYLKQVLIQIFFFVRNKCGRNVKNSIDGFCVEFVERNINFETDILVRNRTFQTLKPLGNHKAGNIDRKEIGAGAKVNKWQNPELQN